MDSLGTRLADLREKKGLTQTDLETASGVRQTTISAIELSKQKPRETTLRLLAIGLNVGFDDFKGYLHGKKRIDVRHTLGPRQATPESWIDRHPALFGTAVQILTRLGEDEVKEFVRAFGDVSGPSRTGDRSEDRPSSPGRTSSGRGMVS